MILVCSTREELKIQLSSLSSRSCCCSKKPVFVLSLVSFRGHTSQDTKHYVLFIIYLYSPLFPQPNWKLLQGLESHEPLCFYFPAQCLAHGGIYIFFKWINKENYKPTHKNLPPPLQYNYSNWWKFEKELEVPQIPEFSINSINNKICSFIKKGLDHRKKFSLYWMKLVSNENIYS